MQMTDITVSSYKASYNHGVYTMSGGRTSTGEPSLVLRIRTDSGIEGWSENVPLGSDYLPSSLTREVAALKGLGPKIIGLDPRSPALISAVMDRAMMSGMAAKSVIYPAGWDILGRSAGLPTHILLGGHLSAKPPAFSVVGFGEIPITVQKAEAELEKGPTALQLKVGDDANASWKLDQALVFARALGQDITIPLEQPC